MKIGLHAQPSGSVLGGTDVQVCVLAEALHRSHEVDIVHHGPAVTIEDLARFSGTDLSRARLRFVPRSNLNAVDSYNPMRRYAQARRWCRQLSEPYDLFVTFTHEAPPFCHASAGVVMVLFPLDTPLHRERPAGRHSLWERTRRAYARFEWHERLASYDVKMANSEYTRSWVARRWGVDAKVVYPPGEDAAVVADKRPLILSVGRFTSNGNVKCQLEMVQAFTRLALPGWQYVSAGALSCSSADRAYFDAVSRAADSHAITLAPNAERRTIRDLYAQADIFWHAAGLDSSDACPERSEHFGMSTVEAMAAGCVPVVINKGGQPEIVEHGVSGFLWQSVDELCAYTKQLVRDPELWSRMSGAARERAGRFDRRHYVESFLRVLGPHMTARNTRVLSRGAVADTQM